MNNRVKAVPGALLFIGGTAMLFGSTAFGGGVIALAGIMHVLLALSS